MGIIDELYLDSWGSLKIPKHVNSKFEDLGYGPESLIGFVEPIQVQFERGWYKYLLTDDGRLLEASPDTLEGESYSFVLPSKLTGKDFQINIYGSKEGDSLKFEINSHVSFEDGKLVDIFWFYSEIEKDGLKYRWSHYDEAEEFEDVSNVIKRDDFISQISFEGVPESGGALKMALAKSMSLPLITPRGYRGLYAKIFP